MHHYFNLNIFTQLSVLKIRRFRHNIYQRIPILDCFGKILKIVLKVFIINSIGDEIKYYLKLDEMSTDFLIARNIGDIGYHLNII